MYTLGSGADLIEFALRLDRRRFRFERRLAREKHSGFSVVPAAYRLEVGLRVVLLFLAQFGEINFEPSDRDLLGEVVLGLAIG